MAKPDVEFGWMAGAGYDGFDIPSSGNEDYLKPSGIGSFNANTGIRFNYFNSNNTFLGVLARYHIANYKNKGGSSLQGNSFSIDLILGFTGNGH